MASKRDLSYTSFLSILLLGIIIGKCIGGYMNDSHNFEIKRLLACQYVYKIAQIVRLR